MREFHIGQQLFHDHIPVELVARIDRDISTETWSCKTLFEAPRIVAKVFRRDRAYGTLHTSHPKAA